MTRDSEIRGDIMKEKSRADTPPRKVLLGTVMEFFRGGLSERLTRAAQLIDGVAAEAGRKYPGRRLDLVVLPEHAIMEAGDDAKARSVPLEGPVLEAMGQKARQHQTYLIVPMYLLEKQVRNGKEEPVYRNSGVLLDREGKVAGIYHKVHPVGFPLNDLVEGGVTPGSDFPVFQCDFGKVGIQICWDMVYEDGWKELGRQGAEIVAVTSASPQLVRTASYAERMHYYVVTSTPRNNISIFNPSGLVAAQSTSAQVLVHEIDLSYARVGWWPNLDNGAGLTRRFGDKVGYLYSESEDNGIFWSNDPKTSIGSMIRELNLPHLQDWIDLDLKKQDATRGHSVQTQK